MSVKTREMTTACGLWILGLKLELARRELDRLARRGAALTSPKAAAAAIRHGELASRWTALEKRYLRLA